MTKLAGLLLLSLGLAIFGGTVLRVPLLADSTRLDLKPWPDGEEYFAGAVSLYRDHEFVVNVAGHKLAPRYPFGYSLLMVPLLAAGFTPVTIPYVVNEVIGLATVAGLFAALWRTGRPLAAGLAAVLLTSWPSFIIVCRSPLSDLSGGALVLLACWGFVAFAAGGRRGYGIAASFLLGVSVWFKVGNVFFAPLLILTPLALRSDGLTRAKVAAWLGAAYVVGLSPLLWYDFQHFGSIFRTGYWYWVPYWTNVHNGFNPSHVLVNARYWWTDLTGQDHASMVAGLYGAGSYFGVGLVGLIVSTALVRLRRPAEVAVAAALALNVTMLLFYFYQDARLLFSTILVCIPFAAREAAELLGACRNRRAGSIAIASGVALLVLSSVVGAPRQRGGAELWGLLHVSRFRGSSMHYMLVGQLNRVAGEPALVFSDVNPVYVSALASAAHVVVPLTIQLQPYRTPPLVDEQGRQRLLREAVAASRPVYLIMADHSRADALPLTPTLDGYEWRTLYTPGRDVRLAHFERHDGDARGQTSPLGGR